MFTVIFATIIDSFADVGWKKSLDYGIKGSFHSLLGYVIGFILSVYFLFTGVNIFSFQIIFFLLIFTIIVIDSINTRIEQKIYRDEKISVLLPYTQINKLVTIILSFFLFSDVSLLSLLITMGAIFVITLFSINFKTLGIPKYIGFLLCSEFLTSISAIITGYLLIHNSEQSFFVLYVFLGIFSLFATMLYKKEYSSLKGVKMSFWYFRMMGSLGWFSWFLSLVIISQVGLSLSILLSFLGIGTTLLFSFFILKDSPQKKDILLTILVSALVGAGYYFK